MVFYILYFFVLGVLTTFTLCFRCLLASFVLRNNVLMIYHIIIIVRMMMNVDSAIANHNEIEITNGSALPVVSDVLTPSNKCRNNVMPIPVKTTVCFIDKSFKNLMNPFIFAYPSFLEIFIKSISA